MGRPRKQKEQEEVTVAVQGLYKAYCLYVHNLDFFTNSESKEEDMKWKLSNFHGHLCDLVQDFIEKETDKAFEILIINTPPQHGKSTTITETLPSWYLMKHPDNSVIQVSYGDDLAERFGKRNLEKVKEFGYLFGAEVDPKKATSREFQLLGKKGRMISKGIGSGLTGHSGHLIIIDDPIKNREQADSERTRDSIWNEFLDSILTRTQAHSKIILIMTRWHEDDLAGRILENMPDVVTYVNYECECESEDDPLGRRCATEEQDGEALCPEIGKGDDWLRDFKAMYVSENGRRSWEALYQGHPTIQEGNIFKKTWWQDYDVNEYYEGKLKFDQIVLSVDATFKDKEKNDFVAMEVWGKKENRFYLIDLVNEHLSFSDTCKRILLLQTKHPKIIGVYIEDKANGPAILDHMRHTIAGLLPVSPDGASKEARANAIQPLVEAGCVYVPKNAKWAHKFIEQCAKFPNDKHDDMVDAMTQALAKLHYSTRGWIRRKIEEVSGWTLPNQRPKKQLDIGREIHVI